MNPTENVHSEPETEGFPKMLRFAVPDKRRNPEAGYSIGEILVWSGIFAAGIAAVAAGGYIVTNLMNASFAKREINQIVHAAVSYRKLNGDYASIDIEELVDNGYGLFGFTDGENENTFGEDMTVATHASDADAKITYTFTSDGLCEQTKKWVEETISEYKSTNTSCDGSTHKLDFIIN